MSDHTCLADALAAAQGEMGSAEKDGTNPHYKSSFATLQSVRRACQAPLSNHGIAVVQIPSVSDGMVHVETRLMWRDESVSCGLVAKPRGVDPQSLGSVITYLRRYGLMALCGIAPGDDDDGEAATPRYSADPHPTPTPAPPRERRPPVVDVEPEPVYDLDALASDLEAMGIGLSDARGYALAQGKPDPTAYRRPDHLRKVLAWATTNADAILAFCEAMDEAEEPMPEPSDDGAPL